MLRIEAEEPVFYIGPDTRPPRIHGARRHRAATPGELGRHFGVRRAIKLGGSGRQRIQVPVPMEPFAGPLTRVPVFERASRG